MKFAKQEMLRALLILVVQMLTSFMIAYFTDRTWSLKNFISNDTLIVFWVAYLVCIIAIAFFKKANLKKAHLKKANLKKDENS